MINQWGKQGTLTQISSAKLPLKPRDFGNGESRTNPSVQLIGQGQRSPWRKPSPFSSSGKILGANRPLLVTSKHMKRSPGQLPAQKGLLENSERPESPSKGAKHISFYSYASLQFIVMFKLLGASRGCFDQILMALGKCFVHL